MASFRMRIAGKTAAVTSLFESTPAYFRAYLTDAEEDFPVTVTHEDVEFEREQLYREALAAGFRVRNFPDPYLERAAIQRKFAQALANHDTLLLHGSTVAVDGKAYLFTAHSGTGKSTHTRLWTELLGSRAIMVNDDKPFLRVTDDEVYACGAPWSGKHGLDSNVTLPLKGICILRRGAQNTIRRITPEEALPFLLTQQGPPMDTALQARCAPLVDRIAQLVPLWQMECTKDPEAAQVAYAAMAKV